MQALTALDPILDKTEAEAADPAQALLKLSVIDPACGSGHFLLGPLPAESLLVLPAFERRAHPRLQISDMRCVMPTRCCIYGVDRNPMAVELTKVALWIETVWTLAFRFGFFDAQIQATLGVFDLEEAIGYSLDAVFKELAGDNKEVARYYARKNNLRAEKDRIAEGFGFSQKRRHALYLRALRAMPEKYRRRD